VEPDVLAKLAADLADLAHQLGSDNGSAWRLDPGVAGHGQVSAAVDDFASGWRDGRQQLVDALTDSAGTLRTALADYLLAERNSFGDMTNLGQSL
jgi:hypothetical protein